MLNTDDFVVIVPPQGLPVLAKPGEDLSPYVGELFRVNKTVVLRDGRSLSGSIFRGRETSASDELHIMDLLNQQFVSPGRQS